jgi:KDO2-lipid IV(A) lauroyltransferase
LNEDRRRSARRGGTSSNIVESHMENRSKLRIAVEYATARVLFGTLARLPQQLAIGAGRALTFAAYLAVPKLRRIGDLNLKMAFPQMSSDERTHLVRDSMLNLGRHMGEFSRFAAIPAEKLRRSIDCDGLEHIDAALSLGRGAIIVSAHFGAWEMISFAMSAFNYPFEFLVRRIENPAIERLIDALRTRFGNRTIDKRSAARFMLTTLRAGNLLGLMVDINVVRDKGIFVDFFGVPACTTFIAAKLALRTGAPMLPVFVPWNETRRRYVIRVSPPLAIERTGNEEHDVRQLTEKFTKIVEEQIRRYPDQWLWIHKRWRTQPKGKKNFYAALE